MPDAIFPDKDRKRAIHGEIHIIVIKACFLGGEDSDIGGKIYQCQRIFDNVWHFEADQFHNEQEQAISYPYSAGVGKHKSIEKRFL